MMRDVCVLPTSSERLGPRMSNGTGSLDVFAPVRTLVRMLCRSQFVFVCLRFCVFAWCAGIWSRLCE